MWKDSPPPSRAGARCRCARSTAPGRRCRAAGGAWSAVLTTMSRSVRDWNVPPRPMSSTSPSIERASSRMASSAECARSRCCCSSATSRSCATRSPSPAARTDESTGSAGRRAPPRPASYDATVSPRPLVEPLPARLPERVRARTSRCGSCARLAARLPEYLALRGTRLDPRDDRAIPSSRARRRSSPSAATGSTPPSCSPTSSSRSTPSASAWTSCRASDP